ncbi:MAG: methyl-accepting chemotaxis protein [Geminicoccaceae bacterium]
MAREQQPSARESGSFAADAASIQSFQNKMAELVDAAIAGDFTKRLDARSDDDKMNELNQRINDLFGSVDDATAELGDMLKALSHGDLTQRVGSSYQGRFSDLKSSANALAESMAATMHGIHATAADVSAAAAEINAGTTDLSRRTENVASSIEETAASTEQMASTVRQNAENAENANDLASSANKIALNGGQIVEQAVEAMAGIDKSASKITDIITVIDEIAFQTNLLALNASVEAARAGDAGKGFAVVAQEVRALAQRSAQAASDIKNLIQNSNSQVKQGVTLVNRAGEALAEILTSIGGVADIVEQISSASGKQAAGVQQINGAMVSMDDMTRQNSALVEQSTASARALGDHATTLLDMVGAFKMDKNRARASYPSQKRANSSLRKYEKTVMSPQKKLALTSARSSRTNNASRHDGWNEF